MQAQFISVMLNRGLFLLHSFMNVFFKQGKYAQLLNFIKFEPKHAKYFYRAVFFFSFAQALDKVFRRFRQRHCCGGIFKILKINFTLALVVIYKIAVLPILFWTFRIEMAFILKITRLFKEKIDGSSNIKNET